MLVYEGTIGKTVIDIRFDSSKLPVALEAEKQVKETLVSDILLKTEHAEVVISREANPQLRQSIFPISSRVESKAINT